MVQDMRVQYGLEFGAKTRRTQDKNLVQRRWCKHCRHDS